MANTVALKRRITSVKNTKQITKAMELVAASKMRRAQDQAKATRSYREAAEGILRRLSTVTEIEQHPLFVRRKPKSQLIIVVTSDRGLAGAYNGNVVKELARRIEANEARSVKTKIVTVGKKGSQFVSRISDASSVGAYPMVNDNPSPAEIRPVITEAIRAYEAGEVDSLAVINTQFVSNISQQVNYTELLPTVVPEKQEMSPLQMAFFEPSIEEIVEDAVLRLIEVQLWQFLLESLASEHSMRMMAMKSATDNAGEIIDDLTLEFNTARQAAITQEIAEIVGGAEAIA